MSPQVGATAPASTTASNANCLSTRTPDAYGVRTRVAATLKSVSCWSVTGSVWCSANMARIASRWSTASMAKAPLGRATRASPALRGLRVGEVTSVIGTPGS